MAFPAKHDFDYYRGDTYQFDVVLKNQDGTDFDYTTYDAVSFVIATKRGSLGTQYTAAAIKVDPAIVRCTITSTVGRNLAAGTYYYDVQLKDTGTPDVITTVITGAITVTDDVSGAV